MRDEVLEFLESAKAYHAKAARLARKVVQLTTQVEHITPSYSGMPSSGGKDCSAAWAALAELRADYLYQMVSAERREKEVADFIESLPTPEYQEILRLRYCEGLRWPMVVERMGSDGYYYSDRHVFALHGHALNEARKIWREKYHDKTRDFG